MKENYKDYLFVVEGKTDIDFLSSFLDSNFYSVNGSAVNENDVKYLKAVENNKKIVILTDPDFPGMKIREYLNSNNIKCYNAFVKKSLSIKHGKVGVAESTKDEVIRAINSIKIPKNINEKKNNITNSDLLDLKLIGDENSKKLREAVSEKLSLGYCNGKQLLKRLNIYDISVDELREVVKNVKL